MDDDPTFAPATIAPLMICPATKSKSRVSIWLLVQDSVRIRVRVGAFVTRAIVGIENVAIANVIHSHGRVQN